MKKFLALSLALLMLTASLAACNKKTNTFMVADRRFGSRFDCRRFLFTTSSIARRQSTFRKGRLPIRAKPLLDGAFGERPRKPPLPRAVFGKLYHTGCRSANHLRLGANLRHPSRAHHTNGTRTSGCGAPPRRHCGDAKV